MLQTRVSHLPCSLMLNIVPGPSTELGSVCLTAKVCAVLKAAYTLPPFFQATPNGPACCWWLLAVLPIDPRYQLSVLSMTTLKERLVKIQHILTYLQSIPNNQSFPTNKQLLDFEVTFKKNPSATPAFVPTASSPHQLQLRDPPSPPQLLVCGLISAKLSFTLTYTAKPPQGYFE